MARKTRLTVLACLAGLVVSSGALAQSADRDEQSADDWRKAMEEKISQLQEDNERLEQRVADLSGPNWLTEQRAEEIRVLVADVLADADDRASMLQNGLMAGWSEHFFLASPDGRFKLQLDGQMQFRWIYNYHDEPNDRHRQGFEHSRTKLTFRGHVFNPDLTYLIRADFNRLAGPFLLQDAWAQYQINSDWAVRLGQFKLPFSREELVSSSRQLAVERSLVNENMNTGRSTGVEILYARDTFKWMFSTHNGAEDTLGGFGTLAGTPGANSTALTFDVEYAFTSRAEWLLAGQWSQFDDFTSPMDEEFGLMIGLAGNAQQSESGGGFSFDRDETRWYAATADVSAEWGGASAFGSFTYSFSDTVTFGHITIYGVVIQGSVYFTPKFEAFARWEYGWWDFDNADFSDLNVATVGFNYYLDGHDAKWTVDLGVAPEIVDGPWDSDLAGYIRDRDGWNPQVVFRCQFQLLF